MLAAGAQAAYDAVDGTIDQLPMLRDAGVVDAGGFGFAVLLDGLCAAVTGIAVEPGPVLAALTRTERQQIAYGSERDTGGGCPRDGGDARPRGVMGVLHRVHHRGAAHRDRRTPVATGAGGRLAARGG